MASITFPVLETIYDPSLIFSPHVVLLGLISDDHAFVGPSLRSPEQLIRLYIPQNRNQLRIPLDPKLDNIPVLANISELLMGGSSLI
jgi:hypothetical protein